VPSIYANTQKGFENNGATDILSDKSMALSININKGKILKSHLFHKNLKLDSNSPELKKNFELISKTSGKFFSKDFTNPTYSFSDSTIGNDFKAIIGFTNTSAIMTQLQSISQNFSSLFKRRAFLHHFTGEGMDEMEFTERESQLNDLCGQYSSINDC